MNNKIQKYAKWEPEAIESEKRSMTGGNSFFKIPQGRTAARFLPPMQGQKSPFQKVFQHYVDGASPTGGVVSFACPRLNGARRPCPVCAMSDKLRRSPNPEDQKQGDRLRASRRIYANVIIRGEEAEGVRILPFGKTVYEGLMDLAYDPDWGDFTDPGVDGYDVSITRTGSGMTDTRYKVVGSRNMSPLSEDAKQTSEWLNNMVDLTQFAAPPSEEDLLLKLGPAFGGPDPVKRNAEDAGDYIDAEYKVVQ